MDSSNRPSALPGMGKAERGDGKPEAAPHQDEGQLVSRLREHLPAILSGEPVQLAYLYGSTVTGLATPLSDVDVALVAGEALRPLVRLKLVLRVQVALADCCGIPNAEVRLMDEAPLVFRGRVVTDGVLVYARDDGFRVEFETTTRLLYFDYLPIHRELQEAFFQDVRERGLHG
jgi:uncharacterized protein